MKKIILKILALSSSIAIFGLSVYQLYFIEKNHHYHSEQAVLELKHEMQKAFDYNKSNLFSSIYQVNLLRKINLK